MLKLIDWVLLPRETLELAEINDIHEAFNEKKITGEEARQRVYSRKWKYHHDKLDFLVQVSFLLFNTPHPYK